MEATGIDLDGTPPELPKIKASADPETRIKQALDSGVKSDEFTKAVADSVATTMEGIASKMTDEMKSMHEDLKNAVKDASTNGTDTESLAKSLNDIISRDLGEETEAVAKETEGKTGKEPGAFEKWMKNMLMVSALGSLFSGIAYMFLKLEADAQTGCYWYYNGVKQTPKVVATGGKDIAPGWCVCSISDTSPYLSTSADCAGNSSFVKGSSPGATIPHCLSGPRQPAKGQPSSAAVSSGAAHPWCLGQSPETKNAISYHHVVQTPLGVLGDLVSGALDMVKGTVDSLAKTVIEVALYLFGSIVILIILWVLIKLLMKKAF